MKTLKFLLLLNIFILFSGCSAQETETELNLKKCVNEVVNKNIIEAYGKNPFDFYVFIQKIEEKLLSNNLLENTSKKNYLDLLNNLDKPKNSKYSIMHKQQNVIIDDFGFGFNEFIINDAIFNQCPYKASKENKEGEGKLIYELGKVFYKLTNEDYYNKKLINDLFESFDEKNFKKIVYRAPVILLVMINLDNRYNEDLKEYRERQKEKKIFNKNEN